MIKHTINIKDLVGDFCITVDDGQILYGEIYHDLGNDIRVEVNFERTKILATPFLNAAIGQLYRDFTPLEMNDLIEITNVPYHSLLTVELTLENAKRYWTDSIYRQAVDDVLLNEDLF